MVTTTKPITAEELFNMPDDGYRYELIRGELKQMTPAGSEHGRIIINIALSLGQHVKQNKLGTLFGSETGFKIASNPDTVRAPDVPFVNQERLDQIGNIKEYWPEAPDLAVEVISPSDTYNEVEEKVFEWLEAGTRMVIVVNPRNHIVSVYRSLTDIVMLTENDTLDGGDVVPGWTIAVKEIFV